MSRYIDADKYRKDLIELGFLPALVVRVLEKQPTADVEEVRHGRWVVCGTFDDFLTCSVCKSNKYPFGYGFKYCPDCGAKMDGERREG